LPPLPGKPMPHQRRMRATYFSGKQEERAQQETAGAK